MLRRKSSGESVLNIGEYRRKCVLNSGEYRRILLYSGEILPKSGEILPKSGEILLKSGEILLYSEEGKKVPPESHEGAYTHEL